MQRIRLELNSKHGLLTEGGSGWILNSSHPRFCICSGPPTNLPLNEAGFKTHTQSGCMETEISTAHKQSVDNTQILCSMYIRCDKSYMFFFRLLPGSVTHPSWLQTFFFFMLTFWSYHSNTFLLMLAESVQKPHEHILIRQRHFK